MTANQFGKGLVLAHVAFSLLACSFALGVYFQFIDWGWKEPRGELWDSKAKKYEYRVASELDKRRAAFIEALGVRDKTYVDIAPALAPLREAQDRFGPNHLWYRQQLAYLYSAPGDIEALEIELKDGVPELDTPGKEIGKPILKNPVPELKKSYTELNKELDGINKEIVVTAKNVDGIIAKSKKITTALNGLNEETGVKEHPGIYDLVRIENETQNAIKFEMESIRQGRIDALKSAEVYRDREVKLRDDLATAKKNRGQ